MISSEKGRGERRRASTYSSVQAGDGDERAGVAAAAVGDVQLRTADVELRAAVAAGDVEGDLRDNRFQLSHALHYRLQRDY